MKWAEPMITKAGGRLASTREPTVYPGRGTPRRIDFFIIGEQVAVFVDKVFRLEEATISPHRAIALQIRKTAEPLLQWTLRTPKKFPRTKPIGCARQPVVPSQTCGQDLGLSSSRREASSSATKAWAQLASAIEAELCGVTDKWEKEGPHPKWRGRANGPKYVQTPLLPPRSAGAWGKQDWCCHCLLWAINRLQELSALARIAKERANSTQGVEMQLSSGIKNLTAGQAMQWTKLTRKFSSPRSPIRDIRDQADKWLEVSERVQLLSNAPADAVDFLSITVGWANALLLRKKKMYAKERTDGWREWVRKEYAKGGGALHKFVKREVQDPEQVISTQHGPSTAPQDIVEAEKLKWEDIWMRKEQWATAPWRTQPIEESDCLPTPTVDQLRAAAMSFREKTGTGIDSLSPRMYAWLSDQLLQRVGALMVEMERSGVWPEQLEETMIHLIPKDAGGKRPIGLIASLPRIWARVRRPYVRRWREAAGRQYNWMDRGKGASRAVWVQSVMEEAARQRGLASGAVLLDLVKAFEQILLAEVWQAGGRNGFPTALLRMSLECCAFKRRMVFRNAASKGVVRTLSAVTAGIEHATDFMLMILMGPLDRVLRNHIGLRIFLVADDVKMGCIGDEEEVAVQLGQAAAQCIHEVEEDLHMEVSRRRKPGAEEGKTVAVASSSSMEAKLGQKMNRLGINVRRTARNLGVDFKLGRTRTKQNVLCMRWEKAKRLARRLASLGPRAAPRVMQAGISSSISYGISVTGITDGMLAGWRSMIARSFGPVGGRSVTARLLLETADPGLRVVQAGIMDWVCAWWDNLLDKHDMQDAWKLAARTVGMSARPNAAIIGGAGTFFAALRRVGWTSPSPHSVKTRLGHILYFGEPDAPKGTIQADPRAVGRWLEDEYEATVAACSQVARDINDIRGVRGYPRTVQVPTKDHEGNDTWTTRVFGAKPREQELAETWRRGRFEHVQDLITPWFWPIVRAYKSLKRKGQWTAATSMKACIEGGWPTQARLHAMGLAETDRCSCGKEVGSLWHKLSSCQLNGESKGPAPKKVIEVGRAHVWDPLYSRGVPARPKFPAPPPARTWWAAVKDEAERAATGDIYTDGSAAGWHWRLTRAGWAAVSLDDEGKVLWRMGGICGEPHASILRAELTAVLEVLRIAVPPVKIHVDNQCVVDGFERGVRWCTHSNRDAADIWIQVWRKMEDIGEGVTVTKVKAHSTWWEVLSGVITARNRGGNALADSEAKKALKEALRESPIAEGNAYVVRAVAWAKWIAQYSKNWVEDTSANGDGRAEEEQSELTMHSRTTMSHELWDEGGKLLCRRCGRNAISDKGKQVLKVDACNGSAAGRALSRTTGNINHVWQRFRLAVCSLKKKGARFLRPSFVPSAFIDESGLTSIGGEHGEQQSEQPSEEIGDREPWLRDPDWLYLPQAQRREENGNGDELSSAAGIAVPTERTRLAEEGVPHTIRITGALVWCTSCACFALNRLGVGLKGSCSRNKAEGAARRRLQRLHTGLHPITGEFLR